MTTRLRSGVDGSIVLNTAKLKPPRNVYDADVAWVVRRRPEFVSLFFAKENLNSPTFRTRVEIKYPIEAFYQHIWKNTREFHDVLMKDKDLGGASHSSAKDLMARDAERDHSEWSNFEIIARSGFQRMP